MEGYKGFLISPDTSAKELLTTVHSKLSLPGTDKDFFLCAKFFESSSMIPQLYQQLYFRFLLFSFISVPTFKFAEFMFKKGCILESAPLIVSIFSVPDRPLIDTDRPLFLHHEWDTCQSYRFEVRQKPKAIMMVRPF